MAGVKFTDFRGEKPGVAAAMLAGNEATIAKNCKLFGGKLKPLHGLTTVQAKTTAGTPLTIHKYGNNWFEWDIDVDVAPAMFSNDAYDRRIITGDGVPKITNNLIAVGSPPYPSAAKDLGVPAPADTPSLSVTGTPDDPTDSPEMRAYVYTLIDEYGAEGPPSVLSNAQEWRPGQTSTLTMGSLPAGNRTFSLRYIYRTNTGTSGTALQYCGYVTAGTTVFVDTTAPEDLAEVLSTEDFDLPNTGMKGIITLPNGGHAGFFNNVLCFDEPGYPHAWPIKYRLTTAAPIVAIKAIGSTIVVMTESHPYIASGAHPSSAVLEKVEIPQACVAKRGAVDMGVGVVYPSPDGLMMISTQGSGLITQGLLTKDEWAAITPTSIRACYWEGLYLAFYNGGGFAINPSTPEAGIVWFTTQATAMYTDPLTDTVYLVVGNNIVKWDDDTNSPIAYQWRSKRVEAEGPKRFSVARVRAATYPVTLAILSRDGATLATVNITSEKTQRLPPFARSAGFYLDVNSTSIVHEIALGENMGDI